MGLLFLGDEREDFVAMIEEVAEGVENLGLGNAQGLGDLQDRFAAPVQRGHVAHGHSQPINDGLASANAVGANNVRMLRLEGLGHPILSGVKDTRFFTSVADERDPDQSNSTTTALSSSNISSSQGQRLKAPFG
jgi:hypothetical protein